MTNTAVGAPERLYFSRAAFAKGVASTVFAFFVALMANVHGETGFALFMCGLGLVLVVFGITPMWPLVRPFERAAWLELNSDGVRGYRGRTITWRQVQRAEILEGGLGPVKHPQLVLHLYAGLGAQRIPLDVHRLEGITPEQVLVLVERRLAAVRAEG